MASLAPALGLADLWIGTPIGAAVTAVAPSASGPSGAGGGAFVLQGLLILLGVYAMIGLGVAVWFVGWGASRRDPAAELAPLRVRVLFGPGAVAVWPVLLAGRGRRGDAHRTEG